MKKRSSDPVTIQHQFDTFVKGFLPEKLKLTAQKWRAALQGKICFVKGRN